MGVCCGFNGKGRGRHKNMLFGRVYTVYGIPSLFQGHSPGGATVFTSSIGPGDEILLWGLVGSMGSA